MTDLWTAVPTSVEHERLALELLGLRTWGQYLMRLRGLSREERAEWDPRKRAALASLVDHDLGMGAAVEDFLRVKGGKGLAFISTKW
jgi:hypothetical protein